ncbi:MAG: YciK family oxidoreductase [Gammaproteobacteria bacterium]|nr:YciK family oxidoreductase [Gammaproteobacteria bacterium]NNC97650.1 YciK family oxidoreductase [Gammaproteobacteria bacterium]NNM13203.1 YciK family oxidoreductase [Gammaproteobacteria bacterium]
MNTNITSLHIINKRQNALIDKVILVTGAGAGIGRAVALECARQGATVVLLGRTIKKLEKVYDEIVALGKQIPSIYPMDLLGADEKHHEQLAEIIHQEYGRLDGLLHNASILGSLTPIAQYDAAQWQKVMHVNVTAQFVMTKALLPVLLKSDRASVLFTSSSVGRQGRAYWGAYSVSKFATEGMMQVLADEFENSDNIRFNSINPGATHTSMRLSAYPAEDKTKIAKPEDIVDPYVYLLSDESNENGHMFNAQ